MACGRGRGLLLEVAIEICGDAQLRMPEQHRDFHEFDAGRDQQRRGGMSEIVEPAPRQLRSHEDPMQGAEHIARMERRSDALTRATPYEGGEDEARIAPIAAGFEAFL